MDSLRALCAAVATRGIDDTVNQRGVPWVRLVYCALAHNAHSAPDFAVRKLSETIETNFLGMRRRMLLSSEANTRCASRSCCGSVTQCGRNAKRVRFKDSCPVAAGWPRPPVL